MTQPTPCTNAPLFLVHWPGVPPLPTCFPHAIEFRALAEAIGCDVLIQFFPQPNRHCRQGRGQPAAPPTSPDEPQKTT